MTFQFIEFQGGGPVARLTLNRPERMNAICRPMLQEIAEALDSVAADGACRALIVTGAPPAFCAGQDLGEPALVQSDIAAEVKHSLDQFYHPVLTRLHALKVPVVAAVNGVAAGAGANFALNCDIILAGTSASFVQAFARIGLIPDCGGTWILPRLVGPARARALMLLAEPLDAAAALDWGLVYRVVEDEDLAKAAEDLAGRLAQGPTAAYGMTKQALDASAANGLERQLDLERDLQAKAAATADFAEGVAAFAAKRQPVFKGG